MDDYVVFGIAGGGVVAALSGVLFFHFHSKSADRDETTKYRKAIMIAGAAISLVAMTVLAYVGRYLEAMVMLPAVILLARPYWPTSDSNPR